jgi:hypothetical protein
MAIDTRLPLLTQTPDVGPVINQTLLTSARLQDQYRQAQEAPLRQKLLEAQTQGAGLQNKLTKAQLDEISQSHDLKSIVYGALAVKPLLDAGDTQGALSTLTARREQIAARGGDTSDTDSVIAQLQAGDLNGAQQSIGSALTLGQQLGVLKAGPQQPDIVQELTAAGYKPGTPAYEAAYFRAKGQSTEITPLEKAKLAIDREKNQIERDKLNRGEPNKPPAGYRANPDGTLSFIPGGPADPATGQRSAVPTEGERKAGTLLKRLEFSERQLADVVAKSPGAAKPSMISEAVRGIPLIGGDTPANLLTGEARQRVEAAQLDLLDAALTLGTGAAYTKEQLRGYARSYFPQIGDSKETVADKQARLQNVISAARISAGRAAEMGEEPATSSADFINNTQTSIDELVKKYSDRQ